MRVVKTWFSIDPDMLPPPRICENLILFGFQQPAARLSGQVLAIIFILDVWVLNGTKPFSAFNKVRPIFAFETSATARVNVFDE